MLAISGHSCPPRGFDMLALPMPTAQGTPGVVLQRLAKHSIHRIMAMLNSLPLGTESYNGNAFYSLPSGA